MAGWHQRRPPVMVCAHRGASGDFPENTIPAFAAAVALGCEMIEFDVRATADGALVLLHDATVDRTTDGSGSIWKLSFAEVAQLDASAGREAHAGTRMPTLDRALDFLPRTIDLDIHVYPGPEDAEAIVSGVCRQIRDRDLYASAFIAGADDVIERVIDTDAQVRRCLLGSQDRADTYVRLAHEMGCSNLQPLNSITTKELCDDAHRRGLIVHPFYADDKTEMLRLAECGVDGILTNCPKLMVEVLRTKSRGAH